MRRIIVGQHVYGRVASVRLARAAVRITAQAGKHGAFVFLHIPREVEFPDFDFVQPFYVFIREPAAIQALCEIHI